MVLYLLKNTHQYAYIILFTVQRGSFRYGSVLLPWSQRIFKIFLFKNLNKSPCLKTLKGFPLILQWSVTALIWLKDTEQSVSLLHFQSFPLHSHHTASGWCLHSNFPGKLCFHLMSFRLILCWIWAPWDLMLYWESKDPSDPQQMLYMILFLAYFLLSTHTRLNDKNILNYLYKVHRFYYIFFPPCAT